MLRHIALFAVAMGLSVNAQSSPYEDCLSEHLKGVYGDSAVKKAEELCKDKLLSKDSGESAGNMGVKGQSYIEVPLQRGLFSSEPPVYRISVPLGNWKLVGEDESETRSGTTKIVSKVYADVNDKVLHHLVHVQYTKARSQSGNWIVKYCGRKNIHYIERFTGDGDFNVECFGVNHWRFIGDSSRRTVIDDAKQWMRESEVQIPTTLIYREHILTRYNFLSVRVCYNPDIEGFPPSKEADWNANDWHRDRVISDTKRKAYIEKIIAEAKASHPQIRKEFEKYN